MFAILIHPIQSAINQSNTFRIFSFLPCFFFFSFLLAFLYIVTLLSLPWLGFLYVESNRDYERQGLLYKKVPTNSMVISMLFILYLHQVYYFVKGV